MLNIFVYIPVQFVNFICLHYCCRVFLRQSELAVLDILLDEHFMSFFTALVFLLQKFWKESKSRYFVF